ncbi:hypothetical protein [Eleftheria terrae]|uniref:hypothetical protein n=1 Tax=Eleftheria terrae TaxID=1597781 RepID=UPI00263BCFA7|nr:hypothetical protein [Eleftheria terrae]WKB56003.1 hypothetical protein N7L95_28445 [Eleftheria terrae]
MHPNDGLPGTHNEASGFIGSMGQRASATWPEAMTRIAEATGERLESVRAFLDGQYGRQFADDVLYFHHTGLDLVAAVAAAVNRWQSWRVSARTSAHTGIPRGISNLTGFVVAAAFEEERVE